ncbi:MAG: DUF512 domain-containing protein [Actinobacteria bacterium]|nr:DUF512 domain-containing protein [Actinomycetota bacterium]
MPDSGREKGGLVSSVTPGSPAEAAGIAPGDRILSLDGHELHDVIDYQFYLEPERQSVVVDRGGRTLTLEMDSGDNDDEDIAGGGTAMSGDPGIYFAGTVFGPIRTCANNCVFCFIEQVPGGLRQPLYVKDDDFRLSFLHGNFITLNNLREEDLERITGQRLRPLYVSVHATDPEVRARLMGCGKKTAARGLENLQRLGEAGIEIHAQIVLCPGLNDGSVLERTVMDLAEEYAGVASAGIVPVAFSEEFLRETSAAGSKGNSMQAMRTVTTEDCLAVIDAVAAWQERFRSSCGFGFAYAADEFYLRANRPLPPAEYYDDFAQYENGIGIARSFVDEGEDQLARLLAGHIGNRTSDAARSAHPGVPSRIYLLTGTLAVGLMYEACARLSNSLGLPVQPLVAENHLFGQQVTVTGLLGGRDLLRTAAEAGLTRDDLLLVPACTLDSAGERFLDDLRLGELHEALECEIEIF